jgi:hypothetical protein
MRHARLFQQKTAYTARYLLIAASRPNSRPAGHAPGSYLLTSEGADADAALRMTNRIDLPLSHLPTCPGTHLSQHPANPTGGVEAGTVVRWLRDARDRAPHFTDCGPPPISSRLNRKAANPARETRRIDREAVCLARKAPSPDRKAKNSGHGAVRLARKVQSLAVAALRALRAVSGRRSQGSLPCAQGFEPCVQASEPCDRCLFRLARSAWTLRAKQKTSRVELFALRARFRTLRARLFALRTKPRALRTGSGNTGRRAYRPVHEAFCPTDDARDAVLGASCLAHGALRLAGEAPNPGHEACTRARLRALRAKPSASRTSTPGLRARVGRLRSGLHGGIRRTTSASAHVMATFVGFRAEWARSGVGSPARRAPTEAVRQEFPCRASPGAGRRAGSRTGARKGTAGGRAGERLGGRRLGRRRGWRPRPDSNGRPFP